MKEKTESIVLVIAPESISIPTREKFPVDYLTVCGHKFYAPRIGALYHRRDTAPIHPLLFGGGQEFKRRPGTENTPMVVGLGKVIIYRLLWHFSADYTSSGCHDIEVFYLLIP